ncbi:MAG TPA: AAA family ATPase [Rubrobacteraceae bacterium]|nr:AAA family ATPase [Rubrobacteraceae bacterium]
MEEVQAIYERLRGSGHVLLTDISRVGKTTLAKAISSSISANFSRTQFTPDILPSDITGTSIYDPREANFNWLPGPVFAPVLLADEINRATPRTQSPLLEAMAEGQVTVEKETRILPEPFFVVATQNPHRFYGTYPLPEGQLDRFMVATTIGYSDRQAELGEPEVARLGEIYLYARFRNVVPAALVEEFGYLEPEVLAAIERLKEVSKVRG